MCKKQKLESWWLAKGRICVWDKQGSIYNNALLLVAVERASIRPHLFKSQRFSELFLPIILVQFIVG